MHGNGLKQLKDEVSISQLISLIKYVLKLEITNPIGKANLICIIFVGFCGIISACYNNLITIFNGMALLLLAFILSVIYAARSEVSNRTKNRTKKRS